MSFKSIIIGDDMANIIPVSNGGDGSGLGDYCPNVVSKNGSLNWYISIRYKKK